MRITRFFYKNILYKNIEAEKRPKIKNILRICWGSAEVSPKIFFIIIFENTIINFSSDAFCWICGYLTSLSCPWASKGKSKAVSRSYFDYHIIGKNIEVGNCRYNKNILRIFQAHFCEKLKNTEAQRKIHHSYKKKACRDTGEIKFLLRILK